MLTAKEVQEWISSKGTGHKEQKYINGIRFLFVTRKDGWIAVFRTDGGMYYPEFEALDMKHAVSRCHFIEVVHVPLVEFP